jgi:hypothetical protein
MTQFDTDAVVQLAVIPTLRRVWALIRSAPPTPFSYFLPVLFGLLLVAAIPTSLVPIQWVTP